MLAMGIVLAIVVVIMFLIWMTEKIRNEETSVTFITTLLLLGLTAVSCFYYEMKAPHETKISYVSVEVPEESVGFQPTMSSLELGCGAWVLERTETWSPWAFSIAYEDIDYRVVKQYKPCELVGVTENGPVEVKFNRDGSKKQ